MASTYTTIQGDTWDLIAYKLYGEEKYMKNLVLIETLWNVKITVSTFCMFSIFCINRNIVECKEQLILQNFNRP